MSNSGLMTARRSVFQVIGEDKPISHGKKITVVGVGMVGMACTFSILAQHVTTDLVIVDVMADKLRGEMMDLQHGSYFLRGINVNASTDYSITKDSKICIITAGARQVGNETRLDILNKNKAIYNDIVPKLVQYSPNAILIVVSNPVDVLAHYVWKLSGLPIYKVIGSGTNLDTSRFRFLLSEHFGVSVDNCHGWIIGEHGDSSVALWSTVNIAGTRLSEIDPDWNQEKEVSFQKEIHNKVILSGKEVRTLKGCTSWAIGLSVANICDSILKNTKKVVAVSTLVKGFYGVDHEVFLSLPCIIGEEGVISIVRLSMNEEEQNLFCKSADIIYEAGKGAGLH